MALNSLNELEYKFKEKVHILNKQRLIYLISALFVVGLLFVPTMTIFSGQGTKIKVFMATFALFVGGIFYLSYVQRKFRTKFKSEIIKEVMPLLVGPCEYSAVGKLSPEHFLTSSFSHTDFSNFDVFDHVVCNFNGSKTEFANIKAYNKDNSDNSSGDQVIFQGLFFILYLNKDYNQSTLVLFDIAKQLFGNDFGKIIQKISQFRQPQKLINFHYQDFDKHFKVTSTIDNPSADFLTPEMMDLLLNFKKKNMMKTEFKLSLRNNILYIGFNNGNILFEPRLFGSILNVEDLKDAQEFFEFVNHLSVNLKNHRKAA